MSIGPMFGLFLHDAGVSFATIFCYAFGACILGFLSASLVKTPYKPPVKREPISLDRFILLLSIPYGMTTNYVAMYARQIGLHTQTGFFFTFMAVGMAISRIFSGKLVDRGRITQVIAAGLYLVVFSFFLLAGCVYLIQWSDTACTILFLGLCILGEVECRSYFCHFSGNRSFTGVGFRYDVSGFQYLVRQPCPQQSARNGNFHLPDLLGCGNRYRYPRYRLPE